MDASFGLIMLIGKYLFLGLVYVFLYWAFKGLWAQMRAEAPAAAPVVSVPAVATPVARPPVAAPVPAVAAAAPLATPTVTAPRAEEPPPAPVTPMPRPVAPAAQPAVAALVVEEPGSSNLTAGHTINLTAAITIGRADDNGLILRDKFCSSHHAMIFLQQGQRLLRDRNSTNGTLHNGHPVVGDVTLKDGDRIGIGTVTFTYRTG